MKSSRVRLQLERLEDRITPATVDIGFGALEPPLGRLSGFVYVDADNDGVFDAGEAPIPGVRITLTGTDDLGGSVDTMTTTDPSGAYSFAELRPGAYFITEAQPGAFLDGRDTPGTAGNGSAAVNDVIGDIALGAGDDGVNNNFGEIDAQMIADLVVTETDSPGPVTAGTT